ncbi:MAG: DUF1461 domain-containing protein [Clostridia bacterium]|nr:DUF1461 domain-containing protein [Clostridia bacterium]
MNKLKWISNILACLMIVLAALGAVCGAAVTIAMDEEFYGRMSRFAVQDTLDLGDLVNVTQPLTEYTGLTLDEHYAFAGEMVAFMRGETDAQPDILNEKEQQHMLDVRSLVRLAQTLSKGFMTVAAGLAVVIAWTSALGKRRGMPWGVLVGALLVAGSAVGVYALLNAKGFGALFVGFHELLFTNDLWLMNPETDILIRLMPQLLFERAGMELVRLALQSFMITWALLMAVYFIVGSMIGRQITRGK